MLTQLLTEEVISIETGARDWRHAIELATAPLLANGTIEPSYVEALFRSHEELGPYYVLGPGLAMPHARPEDGVNRLGLALTVLKQGVNFDSEGNDPVRLLITLAASDGNSHVETIAQLAELFMNEDDVAAIMAADSKDDILRILARY
ncbi:PTS sugar transporter subunit IIA [Aeromonas caviae]|uniref:PTS sugar transporter subunit IIA n=1 Tax=Aeromonas caviae TaxID=648 RepID=UPI00191DB382|nr:PTS sugar transporter subunit IIA [Aeromonas caviae]MBL0503035.1 PTS sugar transporter subunit IIA [Aeromonas caviae]